ncbi:MAG TPA: LD-carboxypeptidase [Crocinitomicaceae bacterium]|nr:LD-carboxypeptidase [Crocinitomicaceae bacterium]
MKLPKLQKGDTIAIVAPAKAIDEQKVMFAKERLEQVGFKVVLSEHMTDSFHYFSSDDNVRAQDFQTALNNPEVKAILCARGGYGCIRILDRIDWAVQLQNPKWIIGFSDVTIFHQYLDKWEVPSLHATMPLDFQTGTENSIETLVETLTTAQFDYTISPSKYNKNGTATGKIIGGNLSIVYSLIGTNLQPEYLGKILFIEDVGEPLYAIDRMFFALEKSGILDQISGLIVGGMTQMKDSEPGFGKTYEEIIAEHLCYKDIPVCYNFPAGHQNENLALILGVETKMNVTDEHVSIKSI